MHLDSFTRKAATILKECEYFDQSKTQTFLSFDKRKKLQIVLLVVVDEIRHKEFLIKLNDLSFPVSVIMILILNLVDPEPITAPPP